jgi:Rubisco Assembly chaperone C-terminal domain/Rubisco accumulation factor 1 alpha helical domain/Rubisco accumulation factor 1 helix turn helix domain
MTDHPPADSLSSPPLSDNEAAELIQSLRRKQGCWLDWAQACQTLQKAGHNTQTIFEETGFEPIQQNQIIVAAQVYVAIAQSDAPAAVKTHFGHKASDVLYEFRVLSPTERVAAATLAFEQGLDMDEAHELTRAIKDFSRLSKPPEEFTSHPGDIVAYQAWNTARQKSDLQARSQLIARGLQYAHSDSARRAIEKLLTDFTVTPARPVPRLPVYRLDSDEHLPRILPVVGKLPLTKADLQAVPLVETSGSLQIVKFSGMGAWATLPGWQVLRAAADPVVIIEQSERLPNPLEGDPEEVMVVVDRAQRKWNDISYFIIAEDDALQIRWFAAEPSLQLLGQVIIVVRAKKVLDEEYTKELWQLDE